MPTQTKRRFRFADHPWTAMIVFWFLSIVLILGVAVVSNAGVQLTPYLGFVAMTLVVAPFVMRIPRVRRPNHEVPDIHGGANDSTQFRRAALSFWAYCKEYAYEIRLYRAQPVVPLLVLGLTCWLILALSQVTGTLAFRVTQGKPLTAGFLLDAIDITKDLPPRSTGILTSFPVVCEEIAWRGIFLTLFLAHYRERKAVVMAALGFSLLHVLNLTTDWPPIWVLGQILWSFVLGLWYGYSVLKSDSIIPAMLVHWLGNTFMWSTTGYMQQNASPLTQALFGVLFTLGILPTVLLTLWTRWFAARWPFPQQPTRVREGAVAPFQR